MSENTDPYTDYTDPATIDVDVVIANITHEYRMRHERWDSRLSWPNVTVKALADEVIRLRREMEMLEAWHGDDLNIAGKPWREWFEKLNGMVSDPV